MDEQTIKIDYRKMKERMFQNPNTFENLGFVRIEKRPGLAYWFKDNNSNVLAVAHTDTVLGYKHFERVQFTDARGRREQAVMCTEMDDRLGIYILLDFLPMLIGQNQYDILLTDGEETCKSTAKDFEPPRQYNWMFEPDRGGNDVVMYQYEEPKYKSMLQSAGFRVGIGSYTDIADMSFLGCAGFNFGVGYYQAHTKMCHVLLDDMVDMMVRFAKSWWPVGKDEFMKSTGQSRFKYAYEYPGWSNGAGGWTKSDGWTKGDGATVWHSSSTPYVPKQEQNQEKKPQASTETRETTKAEFWARQEKIVSDPNFCWICTQKKSGMKNYILAGRNGKSATHPVCSECAKKHDIDKKCAEVLQLPAPEKRSTSGTEMEKCDRCGFLTEHWKIISVSKGGTTEFVCSDCFHHKKERSDSRQVYNRCVGCDEIIRESETNWADDQSPLCKDCYMQYAFSSRSNYKARCEGCEALVPVAEMVTYGGLCFCMECAEEASSSTSRTVLCAVCHDDDEASKMILQPDGTYLCSICYFVKGSNQLVSTTMTLLCELCGEPKQVNKVYDYIDAEDIVWAVCAPCSEKLLNDASLEKKLGMRLIQESVLEECGEFNAV